MTPAAEVEFRSLWVERRLAEMGDDAENAVSYAEYLWDLIGQESMTPADIHAVDHQLLAECCKIALKLKRTVIPASTDPILPQRMQHLKHLRNILSGELKFRDALNRE